MTLWLSAPIQTDRPSKQQFTSRNDFNWRYSRSTARCARRSQYVIVPTPLHEKKHAKRTLPRPSTELPKTCTYSLLYRCRHIMWLHDGGLGERRQAIDDAALVHSEIAATTDVIQDRVLGNPPAIGGRA